jgi:bacillithiol biosynthesis deacetylase BshB1
MSMTHAAHGSVTARPRSILVVAPHPDDAELGMGGTIAKFVASGHCVTLLDMTDGSPTPLGDRASRLIEAAKATEVLAQGKSGLTRVLLDLPNRMVEHNVAARHAVAGVIRAVQAEMIFVPHFEDAHPDHLACTRIVEDARFDAKLTKIDMPVPPGFTSIGPPIHAKWLIYYYCTHLRTVPQPTLLLDTTGFEQIKARAIDAYQTQFALSPKNAQVLQWIAAQDRFMGSRIGTVSAEGFYLREPLGLGGLDEIV